MKKQRKPELIARIRKLLDAGLSQADIANKLGKAPSTIAFHVRNLGIKPAEYSKPELERAGKRKCVSCGKRRKAGSFPSRYNAECSMCIRARRSK
jgi:IS30 family transposase